MICLTYNLKMLFRFQIISLNFPENCGTHLWLQSKPMEPRRKLHHQSMGMQINDNLMTKETRKVFLGWLQTSSRSKFVQLKFIFSEKTKRNPKIFHLEFDRLELSIQCQIIKIIQK